MIGMIGSIGGIVGNATTTMIAATRRHGSVSDLPLDENGCIDITTLESGPPRPPRWRRVLRRFVFALAVVALIAGLCALVASVTVYFANRYGDAGFFISLGGQLVLIAVSFWAFLED